MPWYVLATLRNPPYFVFSLHSGPGQYRGFFWFYFFNEHLLRFLGLRYPRDYNTVPRFWFWILNLVWIFPWSFYLLSAPTLDYKPDFAGGQNQVNGGLLDRRGDVVFHLLHDAGILFDADLSRAGAAGRIGTQPRRPLGARRHLLLFSLFVRFCLLRFRSCSCPSGACPAPGNIYQALTQTPGPVHSFTRPHP